MLDHFRMLLDTVAIRFDLPVLDWIAAHFRCPFLDALMPLITALGNSGIIWIAIALILLYTKKYRRTGLGMAFALLMGLVVCNLFLKPVVARMRPFDFQKEHFDVTIQLLISRPHDFSFPSGHTIASFESCTVLMLSNKKLGIPATVLAVLIAFSRLYLYVHYPSDVLVSVVLGIIFGIVGYAIATRIPLSNSLHKKA